MTVDVSLFTVFALHHSVFARDSFRKRITLLVGGARTIHLRLDRQRAVHCDLRLVAADRRRRRGALISRSWFGDSRSSACRRVADTAKRADDRFPELAGVQQVGGSVRVHARQDRRSEFKTHRPVRMGAPSDLYRMVPAGLRGAVMTMTRFVFALTSSVYLLIAIPLEERSLRLSSGGAYDRYMREVRWKLLPRIF